MAEHLHLVARLTRSAAGRLAQATLLTLQPMVSTPFASSYIRMVEDRGHLRWLLRYTLEQPIKHGMSGHPALWPGSCLPDLVGARQVEGLSLCIDETLPDFHAGMALRILGLPGDAVVPADRVLLRSVGAHQLVRSTAAALAIVSLQGNRPVACLGRRAVAQLARRVFSLLRWRRRWSNPLERCGGCIARRSTLGCSR